MKKVRINIGKVGLVTKYKNYKRVVTEGTYWLGFNEKLVEYDMTKPFYPSVDLSLLLNDEKLAELLTVIDVKDNEIALQYENGNFKNVLVPGKYAFWKGVIDYSFITVDLSKKEITEDIQLNVIQRPAVLQYVRVFVVESYEKGMLFVDGKFGKFLDAGIYYFWKNATVLQVMKADLRQLQMEVSGQEILTKDKAALRVNFFAKYQVTDVQKALLENKDYDKQLYILMQLAIREFVGIYSLDELLESKEAIAKSVMDTIKSKADKLGVKVIDCGIRDIILPGEVKEIMNQVLVAQKKAQANIITRREETASTRSLLNTAKLMEDNTMLFKLKEMEYVEKIADKINSISLSGGNQVVDQLRDIFAPKQ
jgi:hypothetical protein